MLHLGIILIVLSNCVSINQAAVYRFTLLHTNNMYSQFEPSMYKNRSIGGFGRIATYLKNNADGEYMYLDSGDAFTGSDWFRLKKGEIWREMWEGPLDGLLRARNFGEHELFYGEQSLLDYVGDDARTICSNCDSKFPAINKTFQNYQTHYMHRIGVIGVVCRHKEITAFQNLINFAEVDSAIRNVQREIRKLHYLIPLMILVSHCGYNTDIQLAKRTKDIDVIVSGHSGTFLYKGNAQEVVVDQEPQGEYPTIVKNKDHKPVFILQAGDRGKYVGKFVVHYTWTTVKSFYGNPVLMDSRIAEDAGVRQILNKYRPQLDGLYRSILGKSHIVLDGYKDNCKIRECNIGNFITDAMAYKFASLTGTKRRWNAAGIYIINGGSIATGITTPAITFSIYYRDLTKILPFQNSIHIVRVSGNDLMQALEHSVSDKFSHGSETARPQFLQVSGLRVIYNLMRRPGHRVVSIHVRCEACREIIYSPIDPIKFYHVGMNDYLALGGDGYTMFNMEKIQAHLYRTRLDLLDTVKEFMEQIELVEPVPGERIVLIGARVPEENGGAIIKFCPVLYLLRFCVILQLK